MSAPLRIFYAAGPGDVIGTYRHWKQGQDDPSQVAITYSAQFFDLCRAIGARGYVMSSFPRRARVCDERFIIEHRPIPFPKGPALLYHLGQLWGGAVRVAGAVQFRADVAVVSGGTHWFVWSALRLFSIQVVPTLHCVLWRKSRPPAGFNRLLHWLNGLFFRRVAAGVLSLSEDITTQLRHLTRQRPPRVFPFLPTYRAGSIDHLAPPSPAPPLRVLFAGRIERNKGVFDLLEIAKRLASMGRDDIEFDLCGSGSALAGLTRQARESGVHDRFRCHGHLDRAQMRLMYAAAHVVVAPTTSAFIEGFNKVVAEAVLAGRPVITSSVCPALEYVRAGVVEVPPDDLDAYAAAILRLRDDVFFYESKREGGASIQEPFYDSNRSWSAALRRALESMDLMKTV